MRKFTLKGGLAFKAFVFALILMTAIMVMTLGTLYYFLPRYYFTHMTSQLDRNADFLIQRIVQNPGAEDMRQQIINFSAENDAIVLAFNDDGQPLLEFSSFFTSVHQPLFGRAVMLYTDMAFDEVQTGINIVDVDASVVPFDISIAPQFFDVDLWSIRPNDNAQPAYLNISTGTTNNIMVFGEGQRTVSLMRTVSHPEIDHMTFSSTLQPIYQAQAVILAMIPYLAAAGFVIALVVAYVFSRHLTKPIIKIADAAAKMRQMTPGIVSGVNSNDEVGRLSHTLDKLYQDLCTNIQGLQTEMEKTARLERSKTDLMRAAGHELKTPIAALSGMLDGMIDKVGTYKNHEVYLPELKLQTKRLSKLVNEILIASQTDEAGDQLEITSVDIDALVDETVEQYLPLIEKKGLNLKTAPSNGLSCNTDRRVLSIALSNLLSNAVKYTPDGGDVSIGTTTTLDGTAAIFIENQCPSLDASLMPRWFEPFFTPDYSRDKSKGGTGLGLYIVKKNLDNLELPFDITAIDGGVRVVIKKLCSSVFT